MTLRTRRLAGGFGVEVFGFGESRSEETLRSTLHEWLREHHLVVLRSKERLDDEDQIRLARLLGEPIELAPDTFVQHIHGNPFSYWHCDVISSVDIPPQFTLLNCIVRPPRGPRNAPGDTLFALSSDLFADLAPRDRKRLEARRAMLLPPVLVGHDPFSRARTTFFGSRPELAPMLARVGQASPRELRRVLSEEEATNLELLSRLTDLAERLRTRPRARKLFRMTWNEGDTVIWNNLTVCHRGDATNGASRGNRWMRRSLVAQACSDAEFYGSFQVEKRLTPAGLLDVRRIDAALKAKIHAKIQPKLL